MRPRWSWRGSGCAGSRASPSGGAPASVAPPARRRRRRSVGRLSPALDEAIEDLPQARLVDPSPGVSDGQPRPPARAGLRPVRLLFFDLHGEDLDGAGAAPLPVLIRAKRLIVDRATDAGLLQRLFAADAAALRSGSTTPLGSPAIVVASIRSGITCVLSLCLSIRTLRIASPATARQPSPEGYEEGDFLFA